MRTLVVLAALTAGVLLVGCRTGEITESDTQRMRQEFSEENYKENMYKMGKGAEYEAEKKRQEAESRGLGQE